MIALYINGNLYHLPKDTCKTVSLLLDHLHTTALSTQPSPNSCLLPTLPKGSFGVFVNQTFVSKSLYCETPLHANDHLELVIPVEGG